MPPFEFLVPTPAQNIAISLEQGGTAVFIGANGAGKTRLGVRLESARQPNGGEVHRIGAHRSLQLNTKTAAINFGRALNNLLYGNPEHGIQHRTGGRWQSKPATVLISDFDALVMALYANENQLAVEHRQRHIADATARPPITCFDRLKAIWDTLLPHRTIEIRDNDIRASTRSAPQITYDPGELSDGERVLFYLLGQCLLVKPNTAIVVDEPDLHIHKSIMAKLWDAIETERGDCAFIYLTHDLEFAASRRTAQKFAVREFIAADDKWQLEPVPQDTGLPDDVVSKILGSRSPVLFVEGDGGSLDFAIYRRAYEGFTVLPIGSCDRVIHSVASFRAHGALHRVKCAGIIDADGRTPTEIAQLQARGVYVLTVSEVENLLLLPAVFEAIASALGFTPANVAGMIQTLKTTVYGAARASLDPFCVEYTRRTVDRRMKSIGLVSTNIGTVIASFQQGVQAIDPAQIEVDVRANITAHIAADRYEDVLALFDQKGLLAEAARLLGLRNRDHLEEYVGRMVLGGAGRPILVALKTALPQVTAGP